ncbi:TRAP transporter large permease [Paracoccus pantotrophus]|uniref:TRAP transporter large permease protein n=1 Tax=Paracoccus pantotrophus TaxID=82367 RepID=A0A7H9BXN3_PARPN|nr:TRAP transporter large permease subunit [Paracoccus pantotrophus]MDF3854500.1 TRAP transporter large permease subunit [Paracoccus pantotrophus]QLH15943.1 TRAP transporter large permease subunit [Paracoccus pantotrophus]RDD98876.1 C4-dicarboxylate ABC transporter permease [Paracoccus pantotrophus]WGR64093.1 TRAP transporter large permease subunit [Paracoccus pantotrophus]SFO41097.1 TRAP transporter, DctM subunit [Paracoccus pantotrophus]
MGAIVASLFGLLFGTLAIGAWIGIALLATAIGLAMMFTGLPVDRLFPQYLFNILTTPDLVALPLFILMGEFLFRTRLSETLFSGLAPWAGLLPGRLLHVNVVGCSIFAAISGSSAATTQVVGRMTLKELLARGYSPDLAIGSLAGAGTLGFLIPPSTVMIMYGVLANESILRLFTAGFIPGVLLALVFAAYIMIRASAKPDLVPENERALRHMPFRQRLAALRDLGPVMFLILCVLGSMYGGLATPSEAAALGVVGAFLVSLSQGALNLRVLRDIILGTVQSCSVMGIIILGASVLGNITSTLGIPAAVANVVTDWNLSPMLLIVALIVLYLVLGTALEGFSMIATTLPVVLPLVEAAGFDKIWFGIFMVLVVEMAQITPPVAFNFAVIQNITARSTAYIARVTFPFLLIMIGFAIMLALFPGIVTFLPDLLLG